MPRPIKPYVQPTLPEDAVPVLIVGFNEKSECDHCGKENIETITICTADKSEFMLLGCDCAAEHLRVPNGVPRKKARYDWRMDAKMSQESLSRGWDDMVKRAYATAM